MKLKNKAIISTLTLITVMSSIVGCSNTNSENSSGIDESINYVYGYAPLSYSEYWAGELGVSEESLSVVSDKTDREGTNDAGMFDAVTRATYKHGIYRQQFKYTVEVTGEKVISSETKEKNGKEETTYTTDSSDTKTVTAQATFSGVNEGEKGFEMVADAVDGTVLFEDAKETFTIGEGDDASTYKITEYNVLGFNSVPVAIPEDLVEEAKKDGFVESDEVNADTYGLKAMKSDKTYGSRNTETEVSSDITIVADEDKITDVYNTKYGSDAEAYIYLKNENGDELTEEEYLKYCANFLTAKYEYYGDDSTYSKVVSTYGTKHSSDTWWSTNHGMRIDTGINYDFDRFEGSGSGYYKITLIANGYKDIEAKIHFKDAYPNETDATIIDNKLTITGAEDDILKDATLSISSGMGRDTVKILEGEKLTGDTFDITQTIEAGTEYNVSIRIKDYQPLEFTVIAE